METKTEAFIKKNWVWLWIGGMILMAIIGIAMSMDRVVGKDEAFSIWIRNDTFQGIANTTAYSDQHPVLYYYSIKVWAMIFGDKLISFRLFSVLWSMLLVGFGGYKIKKLFSEKMSVLFIALWILYPFSHHFIVQIRMYNMAAFFVFAAGLYAYEYVKNGSISALAGLGVAGIIASFTDYYSIPPIGVIYLWVFVLSIVRKQKNRIIGIVLVGATNILLYVPRLVKTAKYLLMDLNEETKVDTWIPPVTVGELAGYATDIFGCLGVMPFALILFGCYVVTFFYIWKNEKASRLTAIASLSVLGGVLAFGIGVSILVTPAFVSRYAFSATPMLVLFLAYGLSLITWKRFVLFTLVAQLMVGCYSYDFWTKKTGELTREDIEDASGWFASQTDAEGFIVNGTGYYDTCIWYCPEYDFYNGFVALSTKQKKQNYMVLLDVGYEIPQEIKDSYNIEYLQVRNIMGKQNVVYRMEKK